jgi:hypothetical protein
MRRRVILVVTAASLCCACMVWCGCRLNKAGLLGATPRTPRKGFDGEWRPQWIHPVEIKALPPSAKVDDDMRAWRRQRKSQEWNVRCYAEQAVHASRQKEFEVKYVRGRTPIGVSVLTSVSFTYQHPDKGEYVFRWSREGRHIPDFLKLDETPTTFLLNLEGHDGAGIPVLRVVGVEGCGPNTIAVGGKPGTSR